MSLIKQNHAFGLWDYLFLCAGILTGAWFFLSYQSQDPRSAMDSSYNEQSATLKAAEVLNNFGYSTDQLSTLADFQVYSDLLESLQEDLGRQVAIRSMKDSADSQVFPFYWNLRFYNSEETESMEVGGANDENSLVIQLDSKGRWMGLHNEGEKLPQRQLNREALQYAFKEDSSRDLWKTVPDSAWDGVLSFDVENGYDVTSLGLPEAEKSEDQAHIFSLFELKRLGEYYLNNSAWNPDKLVLQDVQITTLNEIRAAVLSFQTTALDLDQQVSLELTVMPTGSVLNLESDYNPSAESSSTPGVRQLVILAALFIFGVVALFTFFFRMRARAVDTKSSLVISIIGGLLIPTVIFLQNLDSFNLFEGGAIWPGLIFIAIQMAFFGAIGSVGFFVLASIGDSITRQHWQKKLVCYDYLRQGMFFNRPVGEVLLRSVVLMLMLSGLWSLLLWIFPNFYFSLEQTFLNYEAAWAPLFVLLDNTWYSLINILGIYLVAGSLVYARLKNQWVFALFTAIAFALIVPIPFYYGPVLEQFIVLGILGLGMALIYLKWDFLTLLFSHYLFITLILVSGGWLVGSSPDLYVFVNFIIFLIFIVGWAIFSIVKGKEEKSLPSYVPEYVEELAQEERIKQELQIARGVQNSFLPTKTPELEGLDIAALCQPAYETGGDYYDFIQLDDHRVAVTIGDVSGKGIQAAFYMTFTKGILHSLCRETESPAELLKKANRLFCDNASKGTFISLVYGIVDMKNKTFTFSRAGHNPILHLKAKDGTLNELQPNGLGLGLTKTASFDDNIKEVQLALGEGDMLVLYTDGIVEALNETHQFYGGNRLLDQLKNQKNKSSQEIIDILSEDVSSFIGSAKQHDDMTMMVIKMNKH
ncbi:SpoIIE family protein phosphatase [Balneolaceae bacterium YR4-1]|uniref:SpoIIE family protein phosphatase n=1 Tax=Halalkalibaculum roseum TaxID=2709311 RepID=A0A6M1SY69_9BACT|nr:SpoIIE family protein phosphatase [Halalkalibaculum roseum]NGP75497.1 SpoIIE family protein phosphatase [Halalkalibaculum roseum]